MFPHHSEKRAVTGDDAVRGRGWIVARFRQRSYIVPILVQNMEQAMKGSGPTLDI
jgi:hypothetical protein